MIQRIQTFYLALGLILLGLMAALPWGELISGEQLYSFSIKGIVHTQSGQMIQSAVHLLVFWVIILLLQLVAIFLYKKRVLQMRFSLYNILIMIGFVIVAWLFARSAAKNLDQGVVHYQLVLIFPLVVAVLNYLAIRAIGRDEALVRSIDRIR
ncbi:MAG TPA: DUF4293 domain-containing protein [Prolixibacteraceae bacterium]|nr:DUF4293 domain-containing protein [Prolixibacteraceae bacterium]